MKPFNQTDSWAVNRYTTAVSYINDNNPRIYLRVTNNVSHLKCDTEEGQIDGRLT